MVPLQYVAIPDLHVHHGQGLPGIWLAVALALPSPTSQIRQWPLASVFQRLTRIFTHVNCLIERFCDQRSFPCFPDLAERFQAAICDLCELAVPSSAVTAVTPRPPVVSGESRLVLAQAASRHSQLHDQSVTKLAQMASAASPPLPAEFLAHNATMWTNFTAWTAQHLGYAVNVSRLAPSLEDLVLAGPRMMMKLGRLGSLGLFPDAMNGFGQRIVPEATDTNNIYATLSSMAGGNVITSASAAGAADASAAAATDQDTNAIVTRFSLESARGLGSVFSYATSKWALCCIAMAVILNRTHVFAATRRRLRLRWHIRLLLRFLPIALFALQARSLLQSIQCQTSPDFGELRWGNASKTSDLMFTQNNRFLHGVSSTLNFGASDKSSCQAVRMVPADEEEYTELKGSLSLLWPLFSTFCLSQFIETVSCAVQGRGVAAETGMTLFEHSLAFAEADAAVSNQLGWGLFSGSSLNRTVNLTPTSGSGPAIAVTRAMIMGRVNTPPEVLLIAFLSTMGHLTSHVLGIFNLQAKVRLISTGFWALCFMGGIIWSALTFSVEDSSMQGLLRYPTVCIIGVIPHAMVLAGILVCAIIYLLALLLTGLALPETAGELQQRNPQGPGFIERIKRAHANMQANVSLSDIRLRMDMDFYTALLRAGFGAITMASEAVYLNEDRRVNLVQHTWLEADRLREMDELRMQWTGAGLPGSRFDPAGTIGLVPVRTSGPIASSGYARERVAQKVTKNRVGEQRRIRDGVGAAERSGRWLMALEFIMHINRLVVTAWAVMACRFLNLLGLPDPAWLRWLSQRHKAPPADKKPSNAPKRDRASMSEWLMLDDDVGIRIYKHDHVDVEADLRRRLHGVPVSRQAAVDREVDGHLYSWFKKGGWWGNVDMTPDYAPSVHENDDFDATSVITATDAETSSEADWISDDDDSVVAWSQGQRTPTQQSPNPSRESSPILDHPSTMAEMANLLHPTSPEAREEARTLAAHLNSNSIVTRSRYQRLQQQRRSEVLSSNRTGAFSSFAGSSASGTGIPTQDEEEQVLEQVILSRRASTAPVGVAPSAGPASSSSWATGAAGLGPDGPQCVVCQSAPRTIIVWPCRCLSLCDDCRVSLAMNNFDKCVCCRREVISFSRIFVP
jgi:hypothetical protein